MNWSTLAQELDLDALARQVALNSIVHRWQDQCLELAHLPELEVMVKPEIIGQIRQAIENKVGLSLRLEMRSQSTLATETPYQARQRQLEAERQAAIASIRQDPVVMKLQAAFGAELIESSVRKTGAEKPDGNTRRAEH